MSLEALCSPRAGDLPLAHLSSCLAGLSSLLEHHWARAQLSAQPGLLVELCNVMHRQLLTQDSSSIQSTVLSIISLALTAATEDLATRKKNKLKEIFPANQSITDVPAEVAGLGEGGEEGTLEVTVLLSYCLTVLLSYCLCLTVSVLLSLSHSPAL